MAIVNVNSISGINSITAQSTSLNFYTAAGSNLPISAATLNVGTGASVSSPATNVLTLGTNNVESVRIDSSGRLGIGTANPSTIFHIRQPADNNGITISHATRIGRWRLEHSGVNSENFVFIQNNGTSDAVSYVLGRDMHEWYTGNTTRISLTSSGNLGIGTAPTERAHIYSSGDVKLLVETPSSGVNANSALYLKTASEGNWLLQTGNAVSGGLRIYDATAGVERIRVTSSGLVGIGTINPTSHLSVRGTIESLTDTNDPNSSTEGGQLILRAPINQAGTKYRFNIDNYYGTSGGQPSAASNFRIFREDDSTTANGTILFNIDSNGRVVTPLQPRSNWQISANTTTYVRSVFIKRDTGNYVSSVPAGNGSTHGSVGRFTAPLNGTYLITIRGTGTTISGSNELLSVYGSWTSSTNVLNATNEVLDLRCTPLINDGIGWAATLYLNANDYWELDWYRPASTTYVGATVWDISTVLLG